MTETQRARRGHNFLPPLAVRRKVPALYSTEHVRCENKVLWCKWFAGAWTWYAAEVDWDTGECFGYVDGSGPEWGYFNVYELERTRLQGIGLVERDCFFEPTRFRCI